MDSLIQEFGLHVAWNVIKLAACMAIMAWLLIWIVLRWFADGLDFMESLNVAVDGVVVLLVTALITSSILILALLEYGRDISEEKAMNLLKLAIGVIVILPSAGVYWGVRKEECPALISIGAVILWIIGATIGIIIAMRFGIVTFSV